MDSVDAVARSRIDPPLLVRSHTPIEHPDEPGKGCLLIEVPASENGHLYVIVCPAVGREDTLVHMLSSSPGEAPGALQRGDHGICRDA